MDIRVLTWSEVKAGVEMAGVQDNDPVDSLVVSGYAPPEDFVVHRVPGPAGESHRIRCGSYLLKGLLEAELGLVDLPESDDFLPLAGVDPGEVQSEDRLENSAEVTHANGAVTESPKDQVEPTEAGMAEGDSAKGALFFRATYSLVFQELWHRIEEEEVEFAADDGSMGLELSLAPRTEETSAFGPPPRSATYCTAWVKMDCPEAVTQACERLVAGEQPMIIGFATRDPDQENPLGWLPDEFWGCMGDAKNLLDESTTKLVSLMLWRMNIHSGPLALSGTIASPEWSFDGRRWNPVPLIGVLADRDDSPVKPEDWEGVGTLVAGKQSIPFGHFLLQEAWRVRGSHPEVSLVTAVASAETGVKECIANLVPDAAWLVRELPSPPIVKILRECIEQLPAKCDIDCGVRRPPKDLITKVSKAVEKRNKLVHGNQVEIKYDELGELLVAVADLLYLLDYYNGHEWALRHVSAGTMDQLRPDGQ